MKEFSQEVINIAGNDYTLFLNRKGIVAWEKYAKEENAKMEEMQNKYKDLFATGENLEIKDDTNPFESINDIDELADDTDNVSKSYRKLYWIMLYENHKLSLKDVNELYDKAIKEYGEAQLIQLAVQMIEDANKNGIEENNEELKKLPALKPRVK